MKIKRSKKKNVQHKFRNSIFKYDQYWNVQYTERFIDGSEKDYKTIIKARSADLAKLYLKKKTKEDTASSKIKSVIVFMFHKDGEVNGISLSIGDWSLIREASFPNEVNILFKYEQPRPQGYTNRFNFVKQGSKPKNGFKKGHGRIGKRQKYSKKQKAYMIYEGKWIPWPKEEREALKEKIIINLKMNNNSRIKTAKALGYSSSRALKKLLDEKFIEINWSKDYPPPRFFCPEEKRLDGIRQSFLNRFNKMYPKIKSLKAKGFSEHEISEHIGLSYKTTLKYINYANK